MSLTARERQTLHAIEDGLAGSDPGLASRLATFTRLASGEEMPARERIRWGGRLALRRRRGSRRDGVFTHVGRLCRRLGLRRAMLLLCLIAAVAEGTAVMLAVGLDGQQEPPPAPRPCSVILTRLPPVARNCNDANATDEEPGAQPTAAVGPDANFRSRIGVRWVNARRLEAECWVWTR